MKITKIAGRLGNKPIVELPTGNSEYFWGKRLINQTDTSNKEYIIVIYQNKNSGEYDVVGWWGKAGSKLKIAPKGHFRTYGAAVRQADMVTYDEISGGYKEAQFDPSRIVGISKINDTTQKPSGTTEDVAKLQYPKRENPIQQKPTINPVEKLQKALDDSTSNYDSKSLVDSYIEKLKNKEDSDIDAATLIRKILHSQYRDNLLISVDKSIFDSVSASLSEEEHEMINSFYAILENLSKDQINPFSSVGKSWYKTSSKKESCGYMKYYCEGDVYSIMWLWSGDEDELEVLDFDMPENLYIKYKSDIMQKLRETVNQKIN